MFEIKIKPRIFKGDTTWQPKMNGVVLVEKEEQIEPLWKLLCEQDEYWNNYKHIIKVAPQEIDSEADIACMCEWVGKTDIYRPEEINKIIPFKMYQEYETIS